MKKSVIFTKIVSYVVCPLLVLLFMTSCAGTRKDIRISNFKFDFEEKSYRIRSVNCAQQEACYNELIGDDFVAVDLNQDRIIDQIVMGNVKLSEAQKVYEYGLGLLEQENKLEVHQTEVAQYQETEPCCIREIKTFWTKDSGAFNQFILLENRDTDMPVTTVATDQDADGKLDQLVKGYAPLDSIQIKYTDMINRGLESGQLLKENDSIMVKRNR